MLFILSNFLDGLIKFPTTISIIKWIYLWNIRRTINILVDYIELIITNLLPHQIEI